MLAPGFMNSVYREPEHWNIYHFNLCAVSKIELPIFHFYIPSCKSVNKKQTPYTNKEKVNGKSVRISAAVFTDVLSSLTSDMDRIDLN